jgi:hypothetical protein
LGVLSQNSIDWNPKTMVIRPVSSKRRLESPFSRIGGLGVGGDLSVGKGSGVFGDIPFDIVFGLVFNRPMPSNFRPYPFQRLPGCFKYARERQYVVGRLLILEAA